MKNKKKLLCTAVILGALVVISGVSALAQDVNSAEIEQGGFGMYVDGGKEAAAKQITLPGQSALSVESMKKPSTRATRRLSPDQTPTAPTIFTPTHRATNTSTCTTQTRSAASSGKPPMRASWSRRTL